MRRTGLIEIIKYLRHNKELSLKNIFTQLKTRKYCILKHNEWEDTEVVGCGKYDSRRYRCNKCGCVHHEFSLSKP